MSDEEQTPIFDTSLKALSFALNHSKDSYTQPLMSQAANALSRSGAMKAYRPGAINLSGLSGAGQAGIILTRLSLIPQPMTLSLVCRAAKRSFPCACRSACCIGERPNRQWTESVRELSDWVGEFLTYAQTSLPTSVGKKRIKTHPQLRFKLVQKHFGIKYHLVDLGEQFGLSEATVINHRKPIQGLLTYLEKEGWAQLDTLLTEDGIVGAL